jgi:DNA adenine methylase
MKKELTIKASVPSLIKWAGGKKQLLEQFKSFFPKKIERYFEPFVGGGAVAFFVLKYYHPKETFLSDINEELINLYNVTKNKTDELIELLKELKNKHSEEFFFKIREEDPKLLSEVKRAGRFIYLNKTCFNGLYRVNSKGGFNVPFGKHANPSVLMEEDLREIAQLLKSAEINHAGFEEVLKYAKKGDFIYFDPPYDPIIKTSFTTYTKDKFLEEEQRKLAEVFNELHKRGCLVMLSNSETDLIKELYKDHHINLVQARRMINADGAKRGKINEIVVTNYPIDTE